jgi:hypothetical protein
MMLDQRSDGEPETQPLNGILFQLYLQCHNLFPLDIVRISGVHSMTMWRMMHNLLVRQEDALLMRRGLFQLTGELYRVPSQVHAEVVSTALLQTSSGLHRNGGIR